MCVRYIIGPRNTGKTKLIKRLLREIKERNIVFMPSNYRRNGPLIDQYREFSGARFLNGWNETEIKELIKNESNNNLTIILEDSAVLELRKSDIFRELVFNSRSNGINLIMCVQCCIGLPPEIRANIDYVFVSRRIHIERYILKTHELYFSGMEYEQFKKLLDPSSYDFIVNDYTCGNFNDDLLFTP